MAAPRPSLGIGRDGDARARGRVGLVEQVEQAGGGFDQVAGLAEGRIAGDRAEADQIFAVPRVGRVRGGAAWLRA